VRTHIIIAGPGRSGTTLLVRLLDELGFDTGAARLQYFDHARAGLETADILDPEAPHVVKKPNLTWELQGLLEAGELKPEQVEWLVVPLRDLDAMAASRTAITAVERRFDASGGLVRTRWPHRQRSRLAELTYGLFQTAAHFELPLIEYPLFAIDQAYAYRRLSPLLGGRTAAEFERAWQAVVDPSLVRTGKPAVPSFVDARMAALRLRRWVRARLDRSRAALSR
jgi:hypothetical protein